MRARPGSVDDETSAPPPVASSPGPSSSDGRTAARLTPYRPAGVSLYVSDQAVTAASERTLKAKAPLPARAAGAARAATPLAGNVKGVVATIFPPAQKSTAPAAEAALVT